MLRNITLKVEFKYKSGSKWKTGSCKVITFKDIKNHIKKYNLSENDYKILSVTEVKREYEI